jgi:DNA replication protein DnaC
MSNPTHIANVPMNGNLTGVSLAHLAWLHHHREDSLMQEVEVECSQGCGTRIRCIKAFAALTACDECRKKADEQDALDRAKKHWEHICPPAFRDTLKTHPDFPVAQYNELKDWTGEQSLFFYGDSRAGKTRLAMLLLKRALLRGHYVGVLWPEKLKAVKWSRETLELLEHYGRYDVLLMDDALLTGAQDERITDFLKDLIDYLMRFKRRFIITSQIGGDEYEAQADKFDNLTDADKKRIKALLERLREECRVVSFVKPVAVGTDQHF